MTGRALVTGITGQDGGYLAERLLAEGREVHGLVPAGRPRTRARCSRARPGVVLHEGDLHGRGVAGRVVAAAAPDEVYHLGGISSVAFSWQHPVLTADVAALGTARLLEQVLAHQERSGAPVRLVQASSAEIFGDAGPRRRRTRRTAGPPDVAVRRGEGVRARAGRRLPVARAGGVLAASSTTTSRPGGRPPS